MKSMGGINKIIQSLQLSTSFLENTLKYEEGGAAKHRLKLVGKALHQDAEKLAKYGSQLLLLSK